MIFLCLHYNHFFLVIPLYLWHLNHQQMRQVWRQMYFHLRLIFYLAVQEEVLCQVRILPLLWGHLMLFPLLILWIAHLEYKYNYKYKYNLLVTSIAVVDICWYWWAKCFCIVKKCLPIYCIEGIWCVYH